MVHRTMPHTVHRIVHCIMPQPRDARLGQRRRELHRLAQERRQHAARRAGTSRMYLPLQWLGLGLGVGVGLGLR